MAFETIDIQDNAGIQAIKIPENLKINDSKVYVKRIGNGLYIIPFHQPWQSMLDSLNQFSDDFMDNRDRTSQQDREALQQFMLPFEIFSFDFDCTI